MHRLLLLLLIASPASGAAADTWVAQADQDEEFLRLWQEVRAEVEQMIYAFPELPPKLDLTLGFRTFVVDGAATAMDYGDTRAFGTATAHFTSYSETQRFNLSGRLESPADFSADLNYWLGDLLYARALVNGVRTNVSVIDLVDLGPQERYAAVVAEDVSEPHVDVTRSSLAVRLRMPGYPAHAFVDGSLVWRRSNVMDQILGAAGYWDDLARTTIDASTSTLATGVTAGLNAHLGPVEVELAHTESWLERRSDPLQFDYSNVEGASGPVYEHDVVPVLRGRQDSLRLHTSYTGRVVGSAGAARKVRTNADADLTETALTGNADLRWLPVRSVLINVGYRLRDVEHDAPATVALRDLAPDGQTTQFDVKPPVDSTTHVVTARLRYRPALPLAVRGHWRRAIRDRDNGDLWKLPARTLRDVFGGSLTYDVARRSNMRVFYEREEVDAPATTTSADHRDRLRLETNWTPFDSLGLHLEYELVRDQVDAGRVDLLDTLVETRDSTRISHNAFIQLHLEMPPALAATAAYGFVHLAHEPSLAYQTFSQDEPGFEVDHGTSYVEDTHSVSLDVAHRLTDWLELRATGTYARGSAVLVPALEAAREPVSIGRVSRATVHQSRVEGQLIWRLPSDWRLELEIRDARLRFGNQVFNPRRNSHVVGGGISVGKRW